VGVRPRSLSALLVVPLLLAACGGGGDDGSAGGTTITTTDVTTTKPKPPRTTTVATTVTKPRPKPKKKKPARAKLVVAVYGQSHEARAGTPWRFVVKARTGARPVSGTAIVQVLVGRQVVDTLGWFTFRGTLRRTYRFSPQIRGRSGVLLSAKILFVGGSKRATYPVRVV
jgi:hypothetical protein